MDEKERHLSPIESIDDLTLGLDALVDDALDATVVVDDQDYRDPLALDETFDATVVDTSSFDQEASSGFLSPERTPEGPLPVATPAAVASPSAVLADFDNDAPEPPGVCNTGDAYFKQAAAQSMAMGQRSGTSSLRVAALCLLSAAIGAALSLDPDALRAKLAPVLGPELLHQAQTTLPAQGLSAVSSQALYQCLAQDHRLKSAAARYGHLATAAEPLRALAERQALDCGSLTSKIAAIASAQRAVAADSERLDREGLKMLTDVGFSEEQAIPSLVQRHAYSLPQPASSITSTELVAATAQQFTPNPAEAEKLKPAEQEQLAEPLQDETSATVATANKARQPELIAAAAMPQGSLTETALAADIAAQDRLSPDQPEIQPRKVIKDIQWRLFKQKFYNGSIDGIYGDSTDEAVEAFYAQHPQLSRPNGDVEELLQELESSNTNRG